MMVQLPLALMDPNVVMASWVNLPPCSVGMPNPAGNQAWSLRDRGGPEPDLPGQGGLVMGTDMGRGGSGR